MKRPLLACLLLVCCLLAVAAYASPPGDSTRAADIPAVGIAGAHPVVKVFEGLSPSDAETRNDVIVPDEPQVADSILNKREYAHALLTKVLEGQRFLETLDAFSEIELPVGVVKSGGATDYSILIDRIRFTKEGAVMDVYVSLSLPQADARIAFHGIVPLSAEGGIAGNARVFLLGDHRIALGQNALITIRGSDRSYVEFDCSGFLGINMDAELEFTSDLLMPEDERGEPRDERLRVAFNVYTESLHDIILNVTLPPFQVKGLKGFGFHVTQASLDWSDDSNPDGIVFPEEYTSPFLEAGFPDLWQGIYIRQADVKLPPAFARRQNSDRVALAANALIIDNQGLTGSVEAQHLIRDGNMRGWDYTVDKLSLQLTANRTSGFSIEGSLAIPVVKSKDGKRNQFGYVAHRSADGDYIFSVDIDDQLKLDLWAADVRIFSGSSVTVAEHDREFYPSARLNGELSINLLGKGPKAKINSIRFEEMVISSEAPYFRPGTFGFGRKDHHSSISKYPVVLDNITFKNEERRVGLAFDVMVNISGKPEKGAFSGKGGLIIWGAQDRAPTRNEEGEILSLDRHSWNFDGVELTSLRLDIKIPKVVELSGSVRFFDEDKTYGDGFKGSLKGKINAINVEAEALFGKTETFRYWYADALVELKTGVPIVPGVLSAFGFGGGYYSNMKQGLSSGSVTLGRSPSGITYVPDENTIGIRAIVLIGTPRPEAMRGDVSLEVSINRHGGINSVAFTGNANFMSTASLGKEQISQLASSAVAGKLTEKLASLKRGQVYGSVKLLFDNVNDVFHGNMEIYVNVAGGIVRGVSDGNKAGWAVLHFEKNNWYIHIGTPAQPLGLEVARIFKSKSYFMLGKNLPGSPPPPSQVSEILGDVDLDYMRDMNALESGMGIAFGLHFLVDTGDLRFLMFYGRFSAGTGLDFMLKDYGNEFHCAGSSGAIGINGWYANGQAYAFVTGKIGIKVDLRFYKGTYDILSIGAAAILQAKGPNPFWMKGTVGGYYKILGGLVKGRCKFEVTVGQECKPTRQQNLIEDVGMIAEISPANGTSDVDVFTTPQVAFNIPVGEVFEITDIENRKHYFRAVLEEFTVTSSGSSLPGELVWNSSKEVVVFDAIDILPERSKCTARATLTFEERINGAWTKVRFGGKTVVEKTETIFETGDAPDIIPSDNVALSYPLLNQANFYRNEYASGFIELKDGQPYLFAVGNEWSQKIRWTDTRSGNALHGELTYDNREKRILFQIPEELKNGTAYDVEVVNIPKLSMAADHNVQAVETNLNVDAAAGDATLTTRMIEGERAKLEPKTLYRFNFRTSAFNSFVQKMNSIAVQPAIRIRHAPFSYSLKSYLRGAEGFGPEETGERLPDHKLISLEAVTKGNRWFEKYAHRIVYDGYPLYGWMTVSRPSPEVKGVPPVRDIAFGRMEAMPTADFSATDLSSFPMAGEYLSYDLGETVTRDFRDLQHRAVNYAVDVPAARTPRLETLIMSPIPYIRHGKYKVKLSYIIPGINIKTSSYEVSIFNPIPDND